MNLSPPLVFDIETGPLPWENWDVLSDRFSPEDSALSASTGEVLAIGLRDATHTEIIHGIGEAAMLSLWWQIIESNIGELGWQDDTFIGFNSRRFDLPFLIRRSWIHGIRVPNWDIVFDPCFGDLLEEWRMGAERCDKTNGPSSSLAGLARIFGLGEKLQIHKSFADLYKDETTRPTALEYLKRDLDLTWSLAERMQVIELSREKSK